MLNDAARAFLRSAPLAHLVTLDPDEAPHVSMAWVDLDDADTLLMATLHDQRKLTNMRRDPRVAVSFETDELEGPGLRRYLVVRGTAEATAGGAPELLHRLGERYPGPGDRPAIGQLTPTSISG